MAKEHDSWMNGIGVEIGGKNVAVSGTPRGDGGTLALKWEKKQSTPPGQFLVGPVPFFIKGAIRFAVEGQVDAAVKDGKAVVSGSVNAVVGGSVMLGPGVASKGVTVGCFGSMELSANQGIQVSYDQNLEQGKRWAVVTPLTVFIKATGELGALVEIENEMSFTVKAASSTWELYIITLSGFNGFGFDKVDIKDGKDMVLLKQTLAKPGPAIQAAVEKYAPRALKDAADKGAKWTAESEQAKSLGDATGKGLDAIRDTTGVDVGAKVENTTAYLLSDDQETSSQTNARISKETVSLNASHEEYVGVMQQLNLWEGVFAATYTTPAEREAIHKALEADRAAVKGGGTASGQWIEMANALAAKASAKEQAVKKKQREEIAAARQAAQNEDARKLDAMVKQAVQSMEQVRLVASGPGNDLNNRTLKQPNPKARKFWESGMQKFWTPAELQRNQLAGLQGQAKMAKAQDLTGLYLKAKAVFEAGQQQLKQG